jgi:hypothetical protein
MDKSLYETDFYQWAERNAELLRSGSVVEADLEHIAEEIEDMGKSQVRALESRIAQVLELLLKLRLANGILRDQNERGWRASIIRQQAEIARMLRQSPSLLRLVPEAIGNAYPIAARTVAVEFGFDTPEQCPFAVPEVTGMP